MESKYTVALIAGLSIGACLLALVMLTVEPHGSGPVLIPSIPGVSTEDGERSQRRLDFASPEVRNLPERGETGSQTLQPARAPSHSTVLPRTGNVFLEIIETDPQHPDAERLLERALAAAGVSE